MMKVYARLMSGKIFSFELDNMMFIYKVKKLKYLLMRELRYPLDKLDRINIFKDNEKIEDEDILVEEEYLIFVNE